jgi:hypothetical protein
MSMPESATEEKMPPMKLDVDAGVSDGRKDATNEARCRCRSQRQKKDATNEAGHKEDQGAPVVLAGK